MMVKNIVGLLKAVTLAAAVSFAAVIAVQADGGGDNKGARQKLPTPQHGILKDFAGKWKGKGVLRTSGKTENEVVRCQLKSTLIFDSRFLFQDGKCSAVGRTVSFLITLAYDKIVEKYTGSWINSINLGIWSMDGQKNDKNLSFTVVHDDPDNDRKIESTVNMIWIDNNQYRLVMTSADVETGQNFERSNIIFQRK
jgi:hypothetical protein